jgi:hypothetical protein
MEIHNAFHVPWIVVGLGAVVAAAVLVVVVAILAGGSREK